ncbi:uncharacterized protein LOC21395107 [Morus notabilis]|nr:uncharacterized protein LOC21395107 [Morus notabilis]XP_024029768.1 uncharacterized protein LOC21395107 [Morus notabilis]
MAAAEARTARRCSRCYAHECAREASKFYCYPSSSSSNSSKLEFDHAPDTAAKEPQNTTPGYLISYPNSHVLTGRRWWLNQEPNFGRYKDFVTEHNISLEAELEIFRNELINETSDFSKECQLKEDLISKTGMKSNVSSSMEQVKALTKDATEFWYLDDHLMNLESLNCLVSEETKKLSSDFESHLLGSDKSEPWWRCAGKDDLASLVAQKSLEHVENCDLPRPRSTNYRKQPSACPRILDHDKLASPLNRKAERGFSNLEYTLGTPNSDYSPHDSEQTFSNSDHSTTSIDKTDAPTNSENDQNKAQLLKALCLSQKRAREAETAAQKAYTEKEHIITLLFRQASQLFAYKQWLQLLQLENICLQLKNKNQPICNLFPSVLPWAPCKGRQVKKGQHRAARKRHGKPKYDISKCTVAFAVGLGLASAGLLLGWTMGLLFPNA